MPSFVPEAIFKTARRRLLLALLLLSGAPALAQETGEPEPQFPQQQSAGDLLQACASSRLTGAGRERRRYCAGFISGVEEAERLLRPGGQSSAPFCTPPDVTASALANAFVRYGAGHATELTEPAAKVVLRALAAAFPCPPAAD